MADELSFVGFYTSAEDRAYLRAIAKQQRVSVSVILRGLVRNARNYDLVLMESTLRLKRRKRDGLHAHATEQEAIEAPEPVGAQR